MEGVNKLSDGELFALVTELREAYLECGGLPTPERPERFPGCQEATEALEEEDLRDRIKSLGVNPTLILGMAGFPTSHEALVVVAHAILTRMKRGRDCQDDQGGSSKDRDEGPQPKKARTGTFSGNRILYLSSLTDRGLARSVSNKQPNTLKEAMELVKRDKYLK